MEKKIVINVPRPRSTSTGVVRLNREAETVIKRLSFETGLTAAFLVSEIILQAEPLVEIRKEDV